MCKPLPLPFPPLPSKIGLMDAKWKMQLWGGIYKGEGKRGGKEFGCALREGRMAGMGYFILQSFISFHPFFPAIPPNSFLLIWLAAVRKKAENLPHSLLKLFFLLIHFCVLFLPICAEFFGRKFGVPSHFRDELQHAKLQK
jgi:hypothetical protein